MPSVIQVQRGIEADLPVLADGEFYWSHDSERLYVGYGGVAYEVGVGAGPGTVTNTGDLTDHGVVVGNGGVDVSTITVGTDGQLLIGQTGADPAFTTVSGDITISALGVTAIGALKVTNAMLAGSIDLTTKVTGDLPFANIAQLAGLSVAGVAGSATADLAAITAGTDFHVLRRASSSSLAFALIDGRSVDFVGASGYRNAAGTNLALNNTYVRVPLDAELFDTNSILDSTSTKGRFTVPAGMGGKWRLSGWVTMGSFVAGVLVAARWYKNNTTSVADYFTYTPAAAYCQVPLERTVVLAAGDYVEFMGYQNSGANKEFLAGTNNTWAEITYMGT